MKSPPPPPCKHTGFQWTSGGGGLPPGTALLEAGGGAVCGCEDKDFPLSTRLMGTLKFYGEELGDWGICVAVFVLETC